MAPLFFLHLPREKGSEACLLRVQTSYLGVVLGLALASVEHHKLEVVFLMGTWAEVGCTLAAGVEAALGTLAALALALDTLAALALALDTLAPALGTSPAVFPFASLVEMMVS